MLFMHTNQVKCGNFMRIGWRVTAKSNLNWYQAQDSKNNLVKPQISI